MDSALTRSQVVSGIHSFDLAFIKYFVLCLLILCVILTLVYIYPNGITHKRLHTCSHSEENMYFVFSFIFFKYFGSKLPR